VSFFDDDFFEQGRSSKIFEVMGNMAVGKFPLKKKPAKIEI
jgi:hypothetical protein